MQGVLTGFAIIGFVVAAGYVAARLRIGGVHAREALNRVGFFIASPALLFTIVADADLGRLLGAPLLVQLVAALTAAGVFVVVNRLWWRLQVPETAIGALGSGYVNAGNIGLPVAAYVIGDATAVVPIIGLQLLIVSPLVLLLLDSATSRRVSLGFVLSQPVRNPIILGALAGAAVSLTGVTVPDVVLAPLEILGGAAVPMILLAFGMSLHGSRPLRGEEGRAPVVVATVLKALVMPAVAFAVARFGFGLDDEAVATAVTLAALPAAQNIYNYAARFRRGEVLARDTVLMTTLASPVVMIAAAALLT
ncbi:MULTISPECIES: AEC family transporter [unclassified Isoptericola]|uniref:AEC family transporter n=1 Tax=unclassified Isoptericola TaxID=2623355 RepID=UPI002712D2D3|nr:MULTISPECIES: AEC family transporter [unclassified Isoptericola]MDO8144360.1 AEC family transporter [Isoptericola sp. 178]MDO8148214.1 AEC family transporter [Isoptericola sp. b515]